MLCTLPELCSVPSLTQLSAPPVARRAVYGDADAIRIVKKPLTFMYQLLTKALSGESQSASVTCSLAADGTSHPMALRLVVVVKGEFDDSAYDFKLPDVTAAADSSRLQDMILDLRQVGGSGGAERGARGTGGGTRVALQP